jgi:hypothetical protein
MRKRHSVLIVASTIIVGAIAPADTDTTRAAGQEVARGGTVRIRIDIDGSAMTATLTDSDTSTDFVSLLPLTLRLKDYAAAEKISDLPRRLSTKGAPAGIEPSTGLSSWARLTAGVDTLKRTGPVQVKITRVEQ